MSVGYIYKITNILNSKIYIGKRQRSVFDETYWGSGKYIKNAIAKYGKENFEREILCWCDSIEDLNEKEKFYIEQYNTRDKSIGYNLLRGGLGGSAYGKDNGAFGKHWYTDGENQVLCFEGDEPSGWHRGYSENRKNIAQHINLGKHFSDEHRRKISVANKLNPSNGMFGKAQSDFQKKRASETHKGISLSDEVKQKISKSVRKAYEENPQLRNRPPLSIEHRQKLSESHKGKTHVLSQEAKDKIGNKNRQQYTGTVVVNDGIHVYHIKLNELEQYLGRGYNRGKITKGQQAPNRGRRCINNGKINKYVLTQELESYLTDGWTVGMIRI